MNISICQFCFSTILNIKLLGRHSQKLIIAIVAVFLHIQSNHVTRSAAMSSSQLNLAQSVQAFSTDLYQIIRENAGPNENIILSPLSIQFAVGLALMGAEGKTAQEIATGLKLGDASRDVVSSAFEEFLAPLKDNAMLKIANKVYVKNDYHIKSAFNEIATKRFQSETETMNFSESLKSANAINQWVESKTNNLIKDLISADSLTEDTRLVLVNAIYFKGFWEHQFPVHATFKEPFFNNEKDSVEVDMMHLEEKLPYADLPDLDAKAIQLKYKDSDMSMVVVLPNQREGLAALDTQLKSVPLQRIVEQMHSNEKVQVSLPKFKVEFEISLPKVLAKLGMSTMFTDAADFSSLLEEEESLYVSDVIHKAFIEVNEEGAEAAAATGMMMMSRSMPMPYFKHTFNANHPFRYFIQNNKHLNIFAGSFQANTS